MGVTAWIARRVVRADVRPSEILLVWGSGTLRLEEYLRDGPGGRLFWRVAAVISTLACTVFSVAVLALPWHHPDARPGAPAWWTWTIGLPGGLGLVWLTALLTAGVRAMHRHRASPRPESAADSR
jgi:hypothetical protein